MGSPKSKATDTAEVSNDDIQPDVADPAAEAASADAGADVAGDDGAPAGDGAPSDTADGPAAVVDSGMVNVADPCPACFPKGWPPADHHAPDELQSVNCPHDVAITYGQIIELPYERAVELGYGPKE